VKAILISATALAFLLTSTQSSPAEENLASSIVGVWKMTSWTRKEVATGKISKTYGEHPVGYNVYARNGRVLVFAVAEGRKTPAKPDPSDAERIELFKSMFAYSGAYKVEGNNKLVYRIDGSWNQTWTGTDLTRQVEIAGNKLTIETAPFKSVTDGQDIVVTTTYERAE
jgi:Lipocalin-like domain